MRMFDYSKRKRVKFHWVSMIDGFRNTFPLTVNTRSRWAVTITRSDYNPIPPGLLHFNLHHFESLRNCSFEQSSLYVIDYRRNN